MKRNGEKIARRLGIVLTRLNDGKRLNVDELAEEFGVSTRTIQRDFEERLSYLPLRFERGSYFLESYCLGKLDYEDIRNFATLSGIRELYPALTDSFLVDLLNSRVNRTILVRSASYERSDRFLDGFRIIHRAIVSHEKLAFHYHGKARVVAPYKLANNYGSWYLVAEEKGILKNFTLSKISLLRSLEELFEPDGKILETISSNRSTWFSSNDFEVLLAVDAEVGYYFERKKLLPSQRIVEKNRHFWKVSGIFSYEKELFGFVRYWIPHIRIIEPSNLQKKLEKELKDYLS
ncbi:helix-turn-helix transcriptional regulator [Hydrogenimonas sp.]